MKGRYLVQTFLLLVILFFLNAIAREYNLFVDLTDDKRFTLTPSTRDLLESVDDVVFVELLLEGDLTSSFRRLQDRTQEVLRQFKTISPGIDYEFRNPADGSVSEINALRKDLASRGIYPTNLLVTEGNQRVEKLIYPYAIVKYGERSIAVNLLEPIGRGQTEEDALNKSVRLLEYKLASAISKLFAKEQPIVMFTEGHGELREDQTAKLESELAPSVLTGRINLDSTYRLDPAIDVLIIAKPLEPFSTRDKFIIDQYIMNGGKVIWLIDQFHVNLDSINLNKVYVPRPVEHQLGDLFFKYGIRINEDLILDLENTRIPQVIGMQGGQAQQEMFPWVYHPLLQGSNAHAMVKNIDRVSSIFVSTVERLDSPLDINHTDLLTSSANARFQLYPMRLSFDILKLPMDPKTYNKSFLPAAVLVEGTFESMYKNRVSAEMAQTLKTIDAEFRESSVPTSQIFVGDGDIIKNLYDGKSGRISPMGYNKWEGISYAGNSDFILNAIDYLLDDYGLIEARAKNVQLRLLNQARLKEEKLKWQLINVGGPVVMIVLAGLFFGYLRRRKYAH